jgi:hypothetical protein
MRTLLAVAAVAEAVTGLALLAFPPLVVELIFGAAIAGEGYVVSRFAGISLIGLGVACWPRGEAKQALLAMLTYNLLVTLYFVFLGFGGEWVGILLWPAAAVHAVLTILLARAWFSDRRPLFR